MNNFHPPLTHKQLIERQDLASREFLFVFDEYCRSEDPLLASSGFQ